MNLNGMIMYLVRWLFRLLGKPFLRLLTERKRNQILTIAHHIKMTIIYGQVLQFDRSGRLIPKKITAPPPPSPPKLKKVGHEPKKPVEEIVPSWVLEEMRELAKIEPELLPVPELLKKYQVFQPKYNAAPGKVYAECRKIIGDVRVQVLILAPWLKRGGADLGVLHHIEACRAQGLQPCLITTLPDESPWLNRVPQGVPVVELGAIARGLSHSEQLSVLVRLVLQTVSGTVHIINSPLGWEMLKAYGKQLQTTEKRVFASLFCDDYDAYGKLWSYARYLPDTLQFLSGIICDTQCHPKKLHDRYGVELKQLHTVYFPFIADGEPKYASSDKGFVLWAGRITRQKRPDLLIKIARAMPEVTFHVRGYVYTTPNHPQYEEEMQYEAELLELPNVMFTGPYELGALLDSDKEYSVFLYTSAWDGLPTILLEATIAGLPIVASSVGGVPELVNDKTGYLVDEYEDEGAYVAAIRSALLDSNGRHAKWHNALALLQERHTSERFTNDLLAIDGYFGA